MLEISGREQKRRNGCQEGGQSCWLQSTGTENMRRLNRRS